MIGHLPWWGSKRTGAGGGISKAPFGSPGAPSPQKGHDLLAPDRFRQNEEPIEGVQVHRLEEVVVEARLRGTTADFLLAPTGQGDQEDLVPVRLTPQPA